MKTLSGYLDKILVIAIASIAIRVAAFLFVMFFNLYDHKGNLVSPLVEQRGIDTPFYQKAAEQYKNIGISILYSKTEDFYKDPNTDYDSMSPLPLFPLILMAFDYEENNTLPLAFLYLILCCLTCIIWLSWLKENGCSTFGLWLFIIIPNPIYFMLAVGTDLPFALLFSVFFVSYFSKTHKKSIWLTALFFLFLLRPNAISVGLFVVFDQINRSLDTAKSLKLIVSCLILLGTLILGFFSLPYFLVYFDLSRDFTYFGISNEEYFEGIYPNLINVFDHILSFLTFLIAKTLYFCGLRPSYSDIPTQILMLRSFVGIFLLPGLIYIFFTDKRDLKILIFLFILPIFIGATQDRYHLAIFPILYLYGFQQYARLFNFLKNILYKGKKFTQNKNS